jgi:hypothetical protein
MEDPAAFFHFPSHDLPGTARPSKTGSGWQWVAAHDATAVAASKLSLLYSGALSGSSRQLFPASKALSSCPAGDGMTLLKCVEMDVPLFAPQKVKLQ